MGIWAVTAARGQLHRAGLDGDLLERDVRNVLNSLLRMLNGNPANLSLSVEIKQRVLIEVAGLCHVRTSCVPDGAVAIIRVAPAQVRALP